MGALFGGETLHELRVALQIAEAERKGVGIFGWQNSNNNLLSDR